jgi:hypothetical protein
MPSRSKFGVFLWAVTRWLHSFGDYPKGKGPVRPGADHRPSPRRRMGDARLEVPVAMSRLPPNPALKELEALIGEWEVEVPQFPGQRGRATFEWLEDGAYLRLHADAPIPRRPPR